MVNEMYIIMKNTCIDLLQIVCDLYVLAVTWLVMCLFISSDADGTKNLHSSAIQMLTSTSVSAQMQTLGHDQTNTDQWLASLSTRGPSTVSVLDTAISQGALEAVAKTSLLEGMEMPRGGVPSYRDRRAAGSRHHNRHSSHHNKKQSFPVNRGINYLLSMKRGPFVTTKSNKHRHRHQYKHRQPNYFSRAMQGKVSMFPFRGWARV